MLRCSRLLAVPVNQADIYGLAHQVLQIFADKIHKSRAQKNVIMDVVNPNGQVVEPDFGGVRLQLHPCWMGGRRRNMRFGHTNPAYPGP